MSKEDNRKWYKLDNAAKIFPGMAKGADTRVFRLVCELYEEIDPDILQSALDEAIREFPYFNCVLRKGLFWYYLDSSSLRPKVEYENTHACQALYVPGKRNLLYKVSYFANRINLEMFHVLADGTGAFKFMRRIVINYIRLSHNIPKENRKDRSSDIEKSKDAFSRYYTNKKGAEQLTDMLTSKAFQIKGVKDVNSHSHLVEGVVSAKAFMELAHSYNTTAGVMIASIFVKSVLDTMTISDLKKPIVTSVPVDLRKHFPSVTSRNFFGVINVVFKADRLDHTMDEIVQRIESSFKELLTKEKILATMNSYSSFEHNVAIKMVPLFIKELFISALGFISRSGVTATVSNLGKITLPESLASYVKQFGAFMATPNVQLTIATYVDRMVFGFCSAFEETDVILNFFRALTEENIAIELSTNDSDNLF